MAIKGYPILLDPHETDARDFLLERSKTFCRESGRVHFYIILTRENMRRFCNRKFMIKSDTNNKPVKISSNMFFVKSLVGKNNFLDVMEYIDGQVKKTELLMFYNCDLGLFKLISIN